MFDWIPAVKAKIPFFNYYIFLKVFSFSSPFFKSIPTCFTNSIYMLHKFHPHASHIPSTGFIHSIHFFLQQLIRRPQFSSRYRRGEDGFTVPLPHMLLLLFCTYDSTSWLLQFLAEIVPVFVLNSEICWWI